MLLYLLIRGGNNLPLVKPKLKRNFLFLLFQVIYFFFVLWINRFLKRLRLYVCMVLIASLVCTMYICMYRKTGSVLVSFKRLTFPQHLPAVILKDNKSRNFTKEKPKDNRIGENGKWELIIKRISEMKLKNGKKEIKN